MKKSVSLANFIYQTMRPYRIGIPILFSFFIGLLTIVSLFALCAKAHYSLIRTISPHLSTLVEIEDRPEMMRILSSMARERYFDLVIVQNNEVIASTRSYSEMDTKLVSLKPIFEFAHTVIDREYMVNSTPVERVGGAKTNAELLIYTPLFPLIRGSLLIALVFLILGLTGSQFYAEKVTNTVRDALKPIEAMDEAIINLLSENGTNSLEITGVKELDRIQTSIIDTKRALLNATDSLAEAKAKVLIAESYQRLIHDLYTPVAALTESVREIEDGDGESKRIVKLAEQILNLIGVAKENLGNESKVLRQEDIRDCVIAATEEAMLAFSNREKVKLTQNIPDGPISIPHDPSNLRRAISNLVSNALRSCKGAVEVELERNQSNVVIRVSDDGPGVKKEDLTLLIQGRLRSKNSDRPGFGLPSANHITKLHGGRLVYRNSATLGGACFEIRI